VYYITQQYVRTVKISTTSAQGLQSRKSPFSIAEVLRVSWSNNHI